MLIYGNIFIVPIEEFYLQILYLKRGKINLNQIQPRIAFHIIK